MPIYKSPNNIAKRDPNLKSIFLAGSVEKDKTIGWREKCGLKLTAKFNIFNPRRISRDRLLVPNATNKKFKEYINWELDALEQADIIILFLAKNSKSPISLLEFGMYAKSNKLLVICEKEFWRKGNIDIVCEKYGIKQFDNFKQVFNYLKNKESLK